MITSPPPFSFFLFFGGGSILIAQFCTKNKVKSKAVQFQSWSEVDESIWSPSTPILSGNPMRKRRGFQNVPKGAGMFFFFRERVNICSLVCGKVCDFLLRAEWHSIIHLLEEIKMKKLLPLCTLLMQRRFCSLTDKQLDVIPHTCFKALFFLISAETHQQAAHAEVWRVISRIF